MVKSSSDTPSGIHLDLLDAWTLHVCSLLANTALPGLSYNAIAQRGRYCARGTKYITAVHGVRRNAAALSEPLKANVRMEMEVRGSSS